MYDIIATCSCKSTVRFSNLQDVVLNQVNESERLVALPDLASVLEPLEVRFGLSERVARDVAHFAWPPIKVARLLG